MATKEEMLFAMQAVRFNLLDRTQVEEALSLQRSLDEQGKPVELGKILVKKGMMSKADFGRLRDAMQNSAPSELILDQVPGYRIEERIGAGGMANVYLAVREEDGLVLALKVLFPTHSRNRDFVAQFLQEARILCDLEHPHIVRAFDFGYTGERYFMTLEHVPGPTVLSLVNEKGRLPSDFACFVISKVARALQYLSEEGLVHRDIKPENVLVTGEGKVKLIDLGFATRAVDDEAGERSDTTCGTVEYISPEQARGESDVDIRADIYSLGASLYHMVVGDVPFSGDDAYEVMAKQVQEGLSQAVKQHGVPKHVHYFIEKMMAKDRDFRYQTPTQVIDEVEGLLASLARIEPGSVVPPTAGTKRLTREAMEGHLEGGGEPSNAPAGAERRGTTRRRSSRRSRRS